MPQLTRATAPATAPAMKITAMTAIVAMTVPLPLACGDVARELRSLPHPVQVARARWVFRLV
jgi:hypothetical protein